MLKYYVLSIQLQWLSILRDVVINETVTGSKKGVVPYQGIENNM